MEAGLKEVTLSLGSYLIPARVDERDGKVFVSNKMARFCGFQTVPVHVDGAWRQMVTNLDVTDFKGDSGEAIP